MLGNNYSDHRWLFRKGLMWVFEDGKNVNFWNGNWMDNSLLIKKVIPDICYSIEKML